MPRLFLILAAVACLCSAVMAGQDAGGRAGRGGRAGGAAMTLPDGNGKELVQTLCTKCHGLNLIVSSWGYTHQGWEALFTSMVDVPAAQRPVLAEYLATNFP